MSHFQHLKCFLCSIVKEILNYEICKSLHFVFICILPSVPKDLDIFVNF